MSHLSPRHVPRDEDPNSWFGSRGMGGVQPGGSGWPQRHRRQEPRAGQSTLADRASLYQNLPFLPHPIPAFSISRRFCPCRDFRPAVCGMLPPSRLQSRAGGAPKWGSSLPVLPGTSLLWKRDLAKGLWLWEIPPPRPHRKQDTGGFAPVVSRRPKSFTYATEEIPRPSWFGHGHPKGC